MPESWPALPLHAWADTCETLHLWTQMAGKVLLETTPRLNQWWNVALHVSTHGLTTGPIFFADDAFEVQFDFIKQILEVRTSEGSRRAFALEPQPVAAFYEKLMAALKALGIGVEINTHPQEIPNAIPFDRDYTHTAYDGEYARRFWRVLLSIMPVFNSFRALFEGKSSPVHFFWGSFDLACTRFSGRPAPPRPGVISSEAYSQEVISAGFWPGGNGVDASFYAYAVPHPLGLPEAPVRPAAAAWNKVLSEFILPYEEVRRAPSPAAALLEFLESTYDAGARLAHWDRATLDRPVAVSTARKVLNA